MENNIAIRRPDLEQIPVAFPDYVSKDLIPWLEMDKKSGQLYYQKYIADAAAQTGRNTSSGTITGTAITSNKVDFACAEVIKRYFMAYDEFSSYATQDKADLVLGRNSLRSFYNYTETSVATALLGGTATDITSDPVTGIDIAALEMCDLTIGKVAMVLSAHDAKLLKANATVKDRMKNTGIVLGEGGNARTITNEQLAAIFGVDKVIIGRDDLWYTGANKGRAALVVLPTEGLEPDEEVQFARYCWYNYDGASDRCILQEFYDAPTRTWNMDAVGQIQLKVLNSNLCKAYQLFANEESTSGSTSGT